MNYFLKDRKVFSKKGIPNNSIYFCDGRLAFSFDDQGIKEIRYFMPFSKSPNPLLFKRKIFDCFRCYAEKDGLRYTPDLTNVTIYPFGLSSDWNIEGKIFKLMIYAVNECVFFLFDGDETYDFAVSFYEETQVLTHADSDFETFDYGLKRTWESWRQAEEGWETRVTEEGEDKKFTLKIKLLGGNISRVIKSKVNSRYTVYTKGDGRFIAIIFGEDTDKFLIRENEVKDNYRKLIEKQLNRYTNVISHIPQLYCDEGGIENFVALAPLYHESLKPLDVSGCVRAQTARYWVWGWDTMVSNDSTLLFDNPKYIKCMLDYFEEVADTEK